MGKYTDINKGVFDFFKQLGVPVYREFKAPNVAKMPYVTLTFTVEENDTEALISGRIWSNSCSVTEVNNISDTLYDLIGHGTTFKINNEGGLLYFYNGSPFIQPYAMDSDEIQCNYFNVVMKTYL